MKFEKDPLDPDLNNNPETGDNQEADRSINASNRMHEDDDDESPSNYRSTNNGSKTPALDSFPFIDWGGSDGFERDFADPIHIIDNLNQALSA